MNINITIALTEHQHREIMAALDDLNSNIAALTSVVSQAIPLINPNPPTTGGATEAQVAAAASAVASQTALLQAAVTPASAAPPATT